MTAARTDQLRQTLLPSKGELLRVLAELRDPQSDLYKLISASDTKPKFSWGVYDFVRCVVFYLAQLEVERSTVTALFPDLESVEPCRFPMISLVVDYDSKIRPCFYGPPVAELQEFDGTNWDPMQLRVLMREGGYCVGCRGKVFC